MASRITIHFLKKTHHHISTRDFKSVQLILSEKCRCKNGPIFRRLFVWSKACLPQTRGVSIIFFSNLNQNLQTVTTPQYLILLGATTYFCFPLDTSLFPFSCLLSLSFFKLKAKLYKVIWCLL